VDIIGLGYATNSVTVNGATACRKGEYFRQQLAVANGSGPVWTNITVTEVNAATNTGNIFVPQTPETFTYDADGNLLSDGRWNYSWDAENRLVGTTANNTNPAVGPQISLAFQYDWKGRRILKQVSFNGSVTNSAGFVYDQWNLIAELNTLNAPAAPTLYRTYLWGLDLSGSRQGAGGVGGLLEINDPTNGVHFAAFDGNGNIAGLVSASSGVSSVAYEYGPFAEPIRATGPAARFNPARFSTKYQDGETGLLYYGYRYCDASPGRWLARDPLGELGFGLPERSSTAGSSTAQTSDSEVSGGADVYSFAENSPLMLFDATGLETITFGGGDPVSFCGSWASRWWINPQVKGTFGLVQHVTWTFYVWTCYLREYPVHTLEFYKGKKWSNVALVEDSDSNVAQRLKLGYAKVHVDSAIYPDKKPYRTDIPNWKDNLPPPFSALGMNVTLSPVPWWGKGALGTASRESWSYWFCCGCPAAFFPFPGSPLPVGPGWLSIAFHNP
jgi:RHS repeat-associated protein